MTRERALLHLKSIRREISQLADLERQWLDDAFLPDDRIGYRAEWANVMDRFTALVDAHGVGGLDQDVTTDLIEVAQQLVASSSRLARMHLRQPDPKHLRWLGLLSAA